MRTRRRPGRCRRPTSRASPAACAGRCRASSPRSGWDRIAVRPEASSGDRPHGGRRQERHGGGYRSGASWFRAVPRRFGGGASSEGVDVPAGLAEQHLLVELAERVDRLLVLVGPAVLIGRPERRVETPLAGRVHEEGAEVAIVDPEVHGERNMPTCPSRYAYPNAQGRPTLVW